LIYFSESGDLIKIISSFFLFSLCKGAIFGFSLVQSMWLYTSKDSSVKSENFITVLFNLSTSATQLLLLDSTPTAYYAWKGNAK